MATLMLALLDVVLAVDDDELLLEQAAMRTADMAKIPIRTARADQDSYF